jgi:hypothetical protein
MSWLSGWPYRKSITLSRASGAVTNYQMKLLVGESSGATGENVDCNGLCLSTFNDLRFTKADGTTLLDYWIESISGTTPNQLATVWIEFDSIGTDATTFYMYYGKAKATAASSGADTFLFFDDFDADSIDTSKWNVELNPTTASSILTCNAAGEYVYSKDDWNQNVALRSKARLSTGTTSTHIGVLGFRVGDDVTPLTELLSNHHAGGYDSAVNYVNAEAWGASNIGASNVEKLYDIAWLSGKTRFAYNNGAWVDITTQVPSSDLPIILGNWSTSGQATFDWVFVRSYLEVEPAWGTWGDAERMAVPACYLHARRDRMNMRPVSTQNNLE